MRPEANPLDLNNFPEDYTRDGKQVSEDASSSAGVYRKRKSGAKEGKEEAGKVYECRFCSLKFCKSQALGGHMNRHRQERETETLNKARQLVFTNDLGPANLGYVSSGQPIPHGGLLHGSAEPGLPYGSIYPSRMYSSPIIPPSPPPRPSHVYRSPHLHPFPSRYPVGDYFLGHAVSNSSYTCIGAPVGHGLTSSRGGSSGGLKDNGLTSSRGGSSGGLKDMPPQNNHEEGLNWVGDRYKATKST